MNEAELLFTEVFKCDRVDLYANRDLRLDKKCGSSIAASLRRRISGEPLQYILGKTEFMGLEFKVALEVFIPRPETEILVETTLSSLVARRSSFGKILDLGTGSGCIAVSLAKFLPNARITAIDISESALSIARQNAILNNVSDKINFFASDLFTEYGIRTTEYDLIVSNPPYICSRDIDALEPEVRREPRIALDGGRDGLDFYRRIINSAPRYLSKGGLLIMEMGFGQCKEIKNIFQKSGQFNIIEVIRDYNNIDRVIVARKAAANG